MTHCMLPASPSWYCSRVIDTNNKGILCFGAKHSIYILDTVTEPPQFKGHIPAHGDRVVGLSFSSHGEQNKLCSASEDGRVKIWDLRDNTLCGEHNEHKNRLSCVHWSPLNDDLIVSSDDKGGLIVWHPSSAEIRSYLPEPNPIFCITCSPHTANHVAIGYKNSQVLIVDVSRKSGNIIIQKLRGHDDEIHSIVWCPQLGAHLQWRKMDLDAPEEDEAKEKQDHLLATGSRDKTIRVWSLERGKPLHFLKLPQITGQRRGWDDTKQRVWVTLYWPPSRPSELISSSYNGELLLWDLARGVGRQRGPQAFSSGDGFRTHNRIVFNIAPAGIDGSGICSISMDRNLIMWDAETLSVRHVVPSLGGFVYCLSQSPINSGRLAAGVGDNLIRVWNVENNQRPYHVNVYWQGIKSKVTTVCWHPTKEGHLGFGTDDGKVGVLDILASRSHGSSTYHKRTVYVVSWGPPSYTADSEPASVDFMLYSVGDGAVLQHNPASLDEGAIDVSNIIRHTNKIKSKLPGRSEISWKPDNSMVAFGNEDGTIEIFASGHLQLLCSVQVHRKLVNCVRWHPEYTAQSMDKSQCQFWIASGSNEAVIQVTDLRKSLALANTEGRNEPVVVTDSFCQLEGHTTRITGLSWSPHHEGMLASASYDWTSQVWDVKKSEAIANYRSHHGRLLCTLWSALDADLVYSGGDDFTIQAWKVSQQTHKAPPVGSEKRKHRNKGKGPKHGPKPPAETKPSDDHVTRADQSEPIASVSKEAVSKGEEELAEIQALLEQKKAELMRKAETELPSPEKYGPEPVSIESPEGAHLEPVASNQAFPTPIDNTPTKRDGPKRDQKDKNRRKMRSLFPLSSTMDNRGKLHTQDDCVTLIHCLKQEAPPILPDDQCHLGYFVDRKNAYTLFDEEINHHIEQGNWDQYTMLETFRGNMGDCIETVTEKRELNDFSVALSAMASPKVWRSTCQAYAAQLEKEGNFPKAASYMLAIHQVYEAIDLLRRNTHYKDAICLARVRLSPDDPVIKSLYASWGHQLASDGNFELSAKCFIAAKQPLEAARLLARRADISALRVASEICIGCGDINNARVYCHKYIQQCMIQLDWLAAAKLIKMHPDLMPYGLLLSTHQSLLQQLHILGYIRDIDVDKGDKFTENPSPTEARETLPRMLLDPAMIKSWLPWKPYTIKGEVFLHHVVRQWYEQWSLEMTRKELDTLDTELTTLTHTRQAQTATKQILVELTCHITLAIIKLLLGKEDEAAEQLTLTMAMCHDNNLLDIWEGLCRLLLPAGADRFQHQCQQMRALRMAALPCDSVDLDLLVTSSSGTNKDDKDDQHGVRLYTNQKQCSPVDSLVAFYNLRVLRYYTVNLDKSCENTTTSASTLLPTEDCIKDVSYSLLWNTQVHKLKLEEILSQISKATSSLIVKHGGETTEIKTSIHIPPTINCDLSTSDAEQLRVYPETPEIRNVSLEAFQKGYENIRSARSKLDLDHVDSDPLMERQESDVFVTMMQGVTPSDESLAVSLTERSLDGSSVDPGAILTVNGENEVENSSPKSTPNASPKRKVSFSLSISETDELGNRYQIYPDVPEDWYRLPVQEKYQQEYVTLMVLSMEQAFTQNELSHIKLNVKDIPFPNPEMSAMILVKLCCHGNADIKKLGDAITIWGQKLAYTDDALKFFNKQDSS